MRKAELALARALVVLRVGLRFSFSNREGAEKSLR